MINISSIQNNNQEKASGAGAEDVDVQEDIMNEIGDIQGKEKIPDSEEITIHTMPEKFHSADSKHSGSKKMGMFIMIGGAILLISIFGGMYYYLFMNDSNGSDLTSQKEDLLSEKESVDLNQKKVQGDEVADENLNNDTVDKSRQNKAIVAQSAKETYLNIKAELDSAQDFYDYAQAIEKYGSEKMLEELSGQKSEYSGLTLSEREEFFISISRQAPKLNEIEDITENISGNIAILYVKIKNISKKGSVKMVYEKEEWKLESEDWPKPEERETSSFKPALDSDNDGLFNKEEELLGCNLSSADSDNDGYEDLPELMNLYNPAGSGKLVENLNISQYFNKTYGYNIYYPDKWIQSAVGGDDSILFKSSDNHFIQIMSQPNAGKIQIEDWYKKQFNVSLVKPEKKIIAENWQGVKSDDGLIVYLTDNSLNYIFIITYNPGLDNVLEYINIFEMAVKSFEVKI